MEPYRTNVKRFGRTAKNAILLIVAVIPPAACHDATAPQTVRFGMAVVASGLVHTCALLHAGDLVCWGEDLASGGARNQVLGNSLPRHLTAPPLVAITAGGTHSCGLTSSGSAYCWGTNEKGQLGDGTYTNRALPVLVATALRFASLAAGGAYTCGIAVDGMAYCWGDGSSGQLGDGVDTTNHTATVPAPVRGTSRFRAIATNAHTCALDTAGHAFCWGVVGGGLSAVNARSSRLRAQAAMDVCASMYDSRDTHCASPTQVSGDHVFTHVTSGTYVDCALDTSELVWCWGDNTYGTLGTGADGFEYTSVPVQVPLPQNAVAVSVGAAHACALAADSSAYCWGLNLGGELGTGNFGGVSPVPAPVVGGHRFVTLSAGGFHTCATTSSPQVFCWGVNGSGELGQPASFSNGDVPTAVVIP
jgi:alpha-tubulin suppressor-like RCC1 family protein